MRRVALLEGGLAMGSAGMEACVVQLSPSGTGSLETGCNKTDERRRKCSRFNEETCQGDNSEEDPNVAGENERGASSTFVNGGCLPDFPGDAECLTSGGCTNPGPKVAGNLVPPAATSCPERHNIQENLDEASENVESDQRLLMKNLKGASLLDNKHLSCPTSTSTQERTKTTRWRCWRCPFKGVSFVHLKKHMCTMHKNRTNHGIIQRSSFVCSKPSDKIIKEREALKGGRRGRRDPGKDREEGEPDSRRDNRKSKYEKFFCKMKKAPETSKSFCCKICSFVFSDPESFSHHMKEHDDGPPYWCPQCEYASEDRSYFLKHLYWHAGYELYQCNFCTFLSHYFNSSVKHSYLHTGARPYSCAACRQGFTSASGLNRHTGMHRRRRENRSLHVAQVENLCSPQTHACDKCGILFYTQAHLHLHKKPHVQAEDRGASSVRIKECKTRGEPRGQADGSRERKTPGPDTSACKKSGCFRGIYSCDRCDLVFNKEEHLVYHKPVHLQLQPSENVTRNDQEPGGDGRLLKTSPSSEPALKLFGCLQCAYMTFSFSNLRAHFTTHTGEKPFKCQECDKAFRNSSHLNRHRWLHVRDCQRCRRCRYVGSTAEDLRVHQETCQDTGPASKRPREHAEGQMDAGEANPRAPSQGRQAHPYKCERCDYATYMSRSMEIHKGIHTGEKLYICEVCQKRFRTSSHLKRHMLVHRKLQLKCRNCDYSDGTWQSFRKHVALHGKAPLPHGSQHPRKPSSPAQIYKCENCSYATVKKGNLRIHSRIHTGEKPYKCSHCPHTFRTSSHLKKHLATHLKLRRRTCDFAPFHKSALRKHARTHEVEEARSTKREVYKCSKCHVAFSSVRLIQVHEKRHTEPEK